MGSRFQRIFVHMFVLHHVLYICCLFFFHPLCAPHAGHGNSIWGYFATSGASTPRNIHSDLTVIMTGLGYLLYAVISPLIMSEFLCLYIHIRQ